MMDSTQVETALERPPIPTRRAWLDAARESSSTNNPTRPSVPPMSIPPMPIPPMPIPPMHLSSLPSQHSPALSAPEPKRRSANLPPAFSSRNKKRTGKPAGASPEIISNLIDSLSNVDFANHDLLPPSTPIHGARVSRTAPGTPVLRSKSSFGGDSLHSRGVGIQDYSTYRKALSEEFGDVDMDDAAEPPVIRTSKRPSGYSEITAPKKSSGNGLASYIRNGYARSTSSLTSNREDDHRSGSFDTTVRRRSLTATSRESLESRLSSRKGHSAMQDHYRGNISPARETIMLGPGIPNSVSEHLYNPRSQPTSPRRHHPFDTLIEEEPTQPVAVAVPRLPEISKREGKKPVVFDSTTPAKGPAVPSRRSSLRHQDITSPPKPHASHTSDSPPKPTATVEEVEEPGPASTLAILESEDTNVTKRIKELKAKKELRELEARLSLTPPPQQKAGDSPFPNPPSAAKSQSRSPNLQGQVQSDNRSNAKVRKAPQPGNIHVPPPGALPEDQATKLVIPQERPVTPLTPTALPINYSYVVNTLNQHSPPASIAPSTNSFQTESTRTESTRPTGGRRSIIVGGRSAAGRSTVAKIAEKSGSVSPPEVNQFGSETNSIKSGQLVDALDTAGTKPKRTGSLRLNQRRWSHPDMPVGIERKTSERASESLAVRPPATVLEERPSSRDSIDQDVNTFVHAARLSQKIRHPTSGRTIAFSEVGDPNGHAVFCCVGMGLTRYVTAFYDELASTLRLRLITPDRPGVGESQADVNGQPLTWPDDVAAICSALGISKFSIMAHSAGAIYALATALRMPQHIRGRVHLLAPWIPPSQMAPIGITKQDPPPGAQLPKSQRFLRVLPAPFLKVANTGFLSAASASLSPNGTNSPGGKKKRKSFMSKESKESKDSKEDSRNNSPARRDTNSLSPPEGHLRRESIMLMDQQNMPDGSAITAARSTRDLRAEYGHNRQRSFQQDEARREIYDSRLTLAIWDKATTNANPAVDLIICLERHQPIGFMYKDITRAVVIHHGSKDTRVPVENVRWLGSAMRRCEVRVLEGQGHGLMAIPSVMGGVLEEVGREWADWEEAVKKGGEIDAIASRKESQRTRRE